MPSIHHADGSEMDIEALAIWLNAGASMIHPDPKVGRAVIRRACGLACRQVHELYHRDGDDETGDPIIDLLGRFASALDDDSRKREIDEKEGD